ncbi:transporter [Enterovibrio norvegicus FF-33]|uniref:Transporter n=1 Tax=Enterovibrio norvegicus FF-454 TaxID=1185651 RepID=A0A1E5BW13_9GAMM|nr:efflux RND transporter permease subunit [Enterovibrio norvegicus]OEE57419.1 transporter [Enterovibrio norvegicus FF-454]OEE67313.1 transporter [Enterovibrio norvegicus FF-33]OEE74053.1 transporter [Enterovibrio norvegicus FF-162]
MKFTDIFIHRPVMAASLSVLLLLLGLNALKDLQVRQYPEMTNTVITVTTPYPGADANLVEGFITQPLEQALAQVDNLDFMTSASQLGSSSIVLNMMLNTNPEGALANVLSQINSVSNQLPKEAYNPSVTSSTGSTTSIMYISFFSGDLNSSQIADYLERVVNPQLSTVNGVSNIVMMGGAPFALRIWPDPKKLGQYDLSTTDLVNILQQNNYQSAVGQFNSYFTVLNSTIDSQVDTVDGLKNLIIKSQDGQVVMLQDVAEVNMSKSSDSSRALANGREAVIIGINATPTANPLDVAAGIRVQFESVKRNLPSTIDAEVLYDSTLAITDSIDEVVKTIIEAAVIVIIVILLFLGSFRAVVIPIVTIPLSLIGVMAVMQAFGFTLNLMTLLAMVLAIGLVVDDAIVVVENVDRHIKMGTKPFKAAIEATREIAVPVISMTITLAAVYAPIALMGGVTGALFKEFALTLAGAVFISGFVALTLSPMMCSKMLKPHVKPSKFESTVESVLGGVTKRYERALHAVLDHKRVVVVFALFVLVSLPILFSFIPSQLAPDEDQGVVVVIGSTPSTSNNDYIQSNMELIGKIISKQPQAEASLAMIGVPTSSQGIAIGPLIPWSDRTQSQKEISATINKEAKKIPGINATAYQMPSLPGASGGLPVQFVITSPADFETLYSIGSKMLEKVKNSPLFVYSDVNLKYDSGLVQLTIDREAAGAYGVTMQAIGATLGTMMSGGYINRVNIDGRSYEVIPEVERANRANPHLINQFYVTAQNGSAVPLSSLVSFTVNGQARTLPHYNQMNAISIEGVPAPNVAMGDAISFLEGLAATDLPQGYTYSFMGEARQFVEEGSSLYLTFALALAIIFLVLASQFESVRDPLVIMFTVPLAISGALIALGWTHMSGETSMNIYSQVGLITLVGLITKHGILMCEVAKEEQIMKGVSKQEAIVEAATVRLRPILMTTSAMIAGLIPLLFATGAGAASRYNIGLVIVAGLAVGTLFTLFVLPVMYTYISGGHKLHEGEMDDEPDEPTAIPEQPETTH